MWLVVVVVVVMVVLLVCCCGGYGGGGGGCEGIAGKRTVKWEIEGQRTRMLVHI